MQVILCHSCRIWSDRCALNGNTVLLCRIRTVNRYLITCLVTVFKSQIIIFCFQINKRKKKFILDHLPENPGHLVSVHLYQRSCHLRPSSSLTVILLFVIIFLLLQLRMLTYLHVKTFTLIVYHVIVSNAIP